MTYSEEEIQKYLHILESYKDIFYDISEINEDYFTNSLKKVSCCNCGNTHFIKDITSFGRQKNLGPPRLRVERIYPWLIINCNTRAHFASLAVVQ